MSRFVLSLILIFAGQCIFAQGSGTVEFIQPELRVQESIGDVSVSVSRNKSNLMPSSVNYIVSRSSATLDVDYSMNTQGVLSWGEGDELPKNIIITILDDPDEETDEEIIVKLFNPSDGSYLGGAATARVVISGEESGSIGFSMEKFITSEMDGEARILLSRRNGLKGAILVDYEVRELSELDEEEHLGQVTHYRRLPDTNGVNQKVMPGVKARAFQDFVPEQGTVLMLDYQSSAIIGVSVLPNFDGDAYPHTVLEMSVSNPRPLTSIDQLEGVTVHPTDISVRAYLNKISGDPDSFVPENQGLVPTVDESRMNASLRINDITGPGPDKIWEEEIAPDEPDELRVGFRFGRARYYVANEGASAELWVYRSAPFDQDVTVNYMVGPNRGFLVDDPRENWEIVEAKENPFIDSLEDWDDQRLFSGNRNADPHTDTGDQDILFGPIKDIKYGMMPGDEPRIMPTALYGGSSRMFFGDIDQFMHNRELDIPIINPGSDIATPTGERELSPSFNKIVSPNDVTRDFHVTTGTLTFAANSQEPQQILVKTIEDDYLEFNEDFVVVLYEPDYERLSEGADQAGEAVDEDGGDDGDDGDDGDGGDGGDENEIQYLKPGVSLGVQYWATVTILSGEGTVAGSAKRDFSPAVNNDIYDMALIRKGLDSSTEIPESREEKLVVVGDFTSINATPLNRIGRVFAAGDNEGDVDTSFNPGTGADNYINSIELSLFAVEGDEFQQEIISKYVIGGGFSSYNGQPRNGIARINADGSIDMEFIPGRGIEDGTVYNLKVSQGNQVLVVGEFTMVDGFKRNSIVRFNVDGSVDEGFDIGEGPDGPIYAVSQMPDGRIVIGGSFSAIGGVPSSSLAVLKDNGQLDQDFAIGKGVLGDVYAIDVVSTGAKSRIVIGGSFAEVKGYKMNNVAVLDSDGELDDAFNVGTGADGPVYSVKIDDSLNVVARNTFHLKDQDALIKDLADLNESDVDLDEEIRDLDYLQNYGEYGGMVPLYMQEYIRAEIGVPMYRILIAGDFRSYNGTRRMGLSRLNPNGSVDTSFLDTAYNQFAGLTAGTSTQPTGLINSIVLGAGDEKEPSIFIGGNFDQIGGGSSRASSLSVSNVAKLGSGETSGPGELEFEEDEYRVDEDKLTGQILIRRKNGRRGFASAIIETENLKPGAGAAQGSDIVSTEEADYLRMQEPVVFEHYVNQAVGTGGSLLWFWSFANDFVDAMYYSIDADVYRALLPHEFEPPEGASGLSVYDRLPTQYLTNVDGTSFPYEEEDSLVPAFGFDGQGWQLQDGENGIKAFEVFTVKDSVIEGNETAKLKLSVPRGYINLGGEIIPTGISLGRTEARLLIIDDDFKAGELKFTADSLYFNEADRTATINVERFNGYNGSISVQYRTRTGTASSPQDFNSRTGSLRFASGQESRSLTIKIVDDEIQEADEYFEVDLFNVTGGGQLASGNKLLTLKVFLVDNDLKGGKVEFAVDAGQVVEGDGEVSVPVRRVGGSRGQASVTYSTRSLTANSGEDYLPMQGILNWAHQDVEQKWITIPIVNDDLIEELESFEVSLANAQNVILGERSQVVLSIDDDDNPGEVLIGDSDYYVNENGSELSVYVKRTEGSKGDIQVDYVLSDGTASSVGDFPDYVQSGGTLYFEDGQTGQEIKLKILDDYANENTEYFSLSISNATGGAVIGSTASARVNIVDDETVNVPAGSVDTFFDTGVGIRVNGAVDVIKRDKENNLLLAGEFTVINGITRKGIAKLDSKGVLDSEFDVEGGTNGSITDILPLQDGSMFIVGDFTEVTGTARNRIAKINSDGYLNDSFDPGAAFDGIVHNIIELTNGNYLLVGGFQNYKGKLRRGLVVLDSFSVDVTPWSNDVGSAGVIHSAIQLADGSIILAGDFEQFSNNSIAQKVAKINSKGQLSEQFSDNFSNIYQKEPFKDGVINEVLGHPDGDIILVGDFNIKTGTGRFYKNIIKVRATGKLVTGAASEDILAAEKARTSYAAAEVKVTALKAEQENANTALLQSAAIESAVSSNIEEANSTLVQANAALVLANSKAAAEGATSDDIAAAAAAQLAVDTAAAKLVLLEAEHEAALVQVAAAEVVLDELVVSLEQAKGSLEQANIALFIAEANASKKDYLAYNTSADGGSGFMNGEVLDAALQPDGKLVVVGNFTEIHGRKRNRIARLTQEGGLDPTINFEFGSDNTIRTLVIQEDYRILIGGDFTSFNNIVSRYIAKVYGGINFGGGLVSFIKPKVRFSENEKGYTIQLKRQLGLTSNGLCKLKVTSNDATKWMPSGNPYAIYDYVAFSTNDELDFLPIHFDIGEVFKDIRIISIADVAEIDDLENMKRSVDGDIPVIYIIDDLFADEPDEVLNLELEGFDAMAPGPQSVSELIIENNDSAVRFSAVAENGLEFDYKVDESNQEKVANFTVLRTGATNRVVSVNYFTEPGTARAISPGQDYEDVSGTITFQAGQKEKVVSIPIIDDFKHEGVESIVIHLRDPKPVGSALLLGSESVELLVDDSDKDLARTQIAFEYNNYSLDETSEQLTLKVWRRGGLEDTTTVQYRTIDYNALSAGDNPDYQAVDGELYFKPGESEKTVTLKINDDFDQENNERFGVELYNSVGAKLGDQSKAMIEIQDKEAGTVMFTRWNDQEDDEFLNSGSIDYFRNNIYRVTETDGLGKNRWYAGNSIAVDEENPQDGLIMGDDDGIRVTITRMEGVHGRIKMDYATRDGDARSGEHYISKSGTLIMEEGQSYAYIDIPILPYGEWTSYDPDGFGGFSRTTVNTASFSLNLFNLRKDDGEPDYVKPQFRNENWQSTSEISATIIVERQPWLHPYVSDDLSVDPGLVYDGWHFARKHHRVRESQGTAKIQVWGGEGATANVHWVALPDNPTFALGGHNWSGVNNLGYGPPFPDGPGQSVNQPDWDTHTGIFLTPLGVSMYMELVAGSDYATPWYWTHPQNLTPESANITPFGDGDFVPLSGRFEPPPSGSLSYVIEIPIINNDEVDFNQDFWVFLYDEDPNQPSVGRWPGDNPAGGISNVQVAQVTIVADGDLKNKNISVGDDGIKKVELVNEPIRGEAAAGSYDRNFNPHSQYDTEPPYIFDPGANNQVHAVEAQPDGKVIIGGDFTSFNSYPVNRLARLYVDGSVDRQFQSGTGADDTVTAIKLRKDGNILIGGGFRSYNGNVSFGLAELNADGSYNNEFDVGAGFDATVRDLKVMENEKIFVVGEFTSYNNTNAVHMARLNPGGAIDHLFAPKHVPNAPVNAVDIGGDGSVIVVGEFNRVGDLKRNFIVKYKSDGRIDPDFESVEGANGIIHDVIVQPDGKIIIAGDFTRINFVERNRIARLNPNGTVDRSFNPGVGFDATVYSIVLDTDSSRRAYDENGNIGGGAPVPNPDHMKIYAAGLFHSFDEVRRYGLARLNSNGMLDTTFMDNSFIQFAGIPRSGAQDPRNFIRDLSLTSDKDLYICGSFKKVGGGYSNFQKSPQNNITRIVGNRYGYYPSGGGLFVDSGLTRGPGSIGFESEFYFADEFIKSHFIKLEREDGNLGAGTVMAGTINPSQAAGSAFENVDYDKNIQEIVYPTLWFSAYSFTSYYKGGWQVSDAFSGINNFGYKADDVVEILPDGSRELLFAAPRWFTDLNEWWLHVNDDDWIEGNERVELSLYRPKSKLYLGGANMASGFALGRRTAYLTTVDDDFKHGTIRFVRERYYSDEGTRQVRLTLERVNGSNGQVSVQLKTLDLTDQDLVNLEYSKANGSSILSDYIKRTVDVTFEPEEVHKSIFITLNNDTVKEPDEAFRIELSKPKGGAAIDGPFSRSESLVVIVDDDYEAGVLSIASEEFAIKENEGELRIPVQRVGGTQGRVHVDYLITQLGDDSENIVLEGTLDWANQNAEDNYIVFDIPDDDLVNLDQSYNVILQNSGGTEQKKPRLGIKKATISVLNDDSYGELAFASPDFYVTENGGEFLVSVSRVNGLSETVSVDYDVIDGTAKAGEDFAPTSGTLVFEPGQPTAYFTVQILNEIEVMDINETVVLRLNNPKPRHGFIRRAKLGTPNIAVLNIIDDERNNVPPGTIDTSFNQSAGTDDFIDTIVIQDDLKFIIGGEFTNVNGLNRSRIARLNPDGQIDGSYNLGAGFDGPVRAIKIDENGKALVVGFFKTFNGISRNGIARLNADGILDETFNPGAGADNPVSDLVIQDDGKIIIVGDFTTYNGLNRVRIARILPNGDIDEGFDPGIGPDFTVNSVDVLPNGNVVIGGDFKKYNLKPYAGIALLDSTGRLIEGFSVADGFNGSVKKVVAQPDLKLIVGGLFTTYQGQLANRITRLNRDGSPDELFNVGTGANASIYEIRLQADGKINVGGDFSLFNGLNKNAIVRLRTDGSVDPTINFGTGANGSVLGIDIRPDYKIIIGGGFTEFNSESKHHIAQIHGGIIRTPGKLQFNFSEFLVNEKGTNATVRVVRTGGLMGEISANFETLESGDFNSATAGIDYQPLLSRLDFPEGEAIQNLTIDILDDIEIEPNEIVDLRLTDFDAGTEGLQSNAKLIITSDDSAVGFGRPLYSVTEGQDGALARIEIKRYGSLLGDLEMSFITATNGTAQASADFISVSNKVQFTDFETNKFVTVPILDDDKIEPIENVVLLITNLVGNAFIQSDESMLNIIDNDFATGEFSFEYPNFKVMENAKYATIGIVRTNGFTGIVEIEYEMSDLTASLGKDYSSESGKLIFSDGDFVQYMDIPILDDKEEEGAEAFKVRLVKATGDAQITPPNFANIIIVDDESEDFISAVSGRGADGPVYSIEPDRNGFLVGGDYSSINGVETMRLSYFDDEGSVSALLLEEFELNNAVYAIEHAFNGIFVGGLFNSSGEKSVNHLVKIDHNGRLDNSFEAPAEVISTVYDIEKWGNDLYVAGSFGVLKLSHDGGLNGDFERHAINGAVYSIDVTQDGIYLAGDFDAESNGTLKNIVRIGHNGTIDDSFQPSDYPDGPVFSVLSMDSSVLIGGGFVTVNGVSSRRIACLNRDGSIDDSFYVGLGFNNVVRQLALRGDGKILASGRFEKWNEQIANRIALLDSNGQLVSDRYNNLNLNGTVYAAGEIPGKLFAFGGTFEEQEDSPYTGLGVVEALTSPLPPELFINYDLEKDLVRVVGESFTRYQIESSLNLTDWTKLAVEKSDSNGKVDFNIDVMRFKSQYFRAVISDQ